MVLRVAILLLLTGCAAVPRGSVRVAPCYPESVVERATLEAYQAYRGGPRPDHPLYAGLSSDVRAALLDLNDSDLLSIWMHEHGRIHLWAAQFDADPRVLTLTLDSSEGRSMVSARKEQLLSLGVRVLWNDALLLYEVVD